MSLFHRRPRPQDIKEDLLDLDIDQLTPVEALLKLHGPKRVGAEPQSKAASRRSRSLEGHPNASARSR